MLGKTDAHSSAVVSVAFSPDGTKIVSGSVDMTIKVWDVGALRALKVRDMDMGAPRSLNSPLRGRN